MLYNDRIGISEENIINKRIASKKRDIWHYWVFLNQNFKFQSSACNRLHDLLMTSINLSDIAILNIKVTDHCCIISLISKDEAITLLQNADLTEKSRTLKKKLRNKNNVNIFQSIYKNGKSYKIW